MRRLATVALIVLAGCSVGGDAKSIDEASVEDLVLQPVDVGADFRPTYARNLADRPVAQVRYRRVREPLSIESAAHVFASSDLAEERLDAERSALDEKPAWQAIGEPGLGDESFAATVVQGRMRSYAVFWRQGNATASLGATAREEVLPFADVLELARKQEHRLAEAAS